MPAHYLKKIITSFFLLSSSIFANEELDNLLQKKVDVNLSSGIVVLVSKNSEIKYHKAFGYAQRFDMGKELKNPPLLQKNALFDLASVTKIMATTQGIMKLVYENKLSLDDKVAKYLPNFAQNGKEDISIKQLLTHSSGLLEWYPLYSVAKNKEEVKDFIFKLPLSYKADSKVAYSDLGFIILGFVIEEITKQPLDTYLKENFFNPLGLKNTLFNPPKNYELQLVATSWGNEFEKYLTKKTLGENTFKNWRNYTLKGEVDDGNAYYTLAGVAGHAGLFSTANDMQILAQLMLNGGTINGIRLYSNEIVEQFITTKIQNRTLGFETNKPYMGKNPPADAFGHLGFTGICFAFSKKENTMILILSNKENVGLQNKNHYTPPSKLCADIMDIGWHL